MSIVKTTDTRVETGVTNSVIQQFLMKHAAVDSACCGLCTFESLNTAGSPDWILALKGALLPTALRKIHFGATPGPLNEYKDCG